MAASLGEGMDQFDEEREEEDIFGPPGVPEDPATPPNNTVSAGNDEEKDDSPSPAREDLRSIQHNEYRFQDGFDSDGYDNPYVPPFVETVTEEDDDNVPTYTKAPIVATATTTTTTSGTIEPIDEATLNGMKIPQLKEELKLRKQPTSAGNKAALIERLRAALLKPKFTIDELSTEKVAKTKTNTTSGLKTFPPTAWWRPLVPNEERVDEPLNPSFQSSRAPTVEARDTEKDFIKHNFDEQFDIPVFMATDEKHRRGRNNKLLYRIVDGKRIPVIDKVPREKGVVDPEFMKKHKLSSRSKPHEIMDVFMPLHKQKGKGLFPSTPDQKSPSFTGDFETISIWTNAKAKLARAGKGYSYYPDFVDFTPQEIRQHMSLYIFQSLSPSPRLEMKFNTQTQDKINGNDFIANTLNQNNGCTRRRHQMFKAFLAFQDPHIATPPRRKYPNWKVRPLMTWMNYIFPKAWLLGIAVSIDEMTMGFQGMHQDKKRITYKTEGDGFQADALAQQGYCYQFYMRNDPPPKKYSMFSPLHARVMRLYDTLVYLFHRVGFDNLYNSAAFCRASFLHPKKPLVHGVTRKGMRGIPSCVQQQEVKNRTLLDSVRGTVKVAKLEGDPECPCLLASSVYDTKPVHYLSMVTERVQWMKKTKDVYNVLTQRKEKMEFLRLNQIDEYNYGMGGVDVADQLRVFYRLDHWLRNRKWWWSILFWALGVMLTNSYVLYTTMCDADGIEKRNRLSHYDFLREIALYWMNPDTVSNTSTDDTVNVSFANISSPSGMSTISQLTTESSGSSRSSARVNLTDNSLGARGHFQKRLFDPIEHFPVECERVTGKKSKKTGLPVRSQKKCVFHNYLGGQARNKIMYCPSCNINLCVDCYKLFHTQQNIVSNKRQLQRKLGIGIERASKKQRKV